MAETAPAATHFLHYFFDSTRVRAEQPLLCEKQGATYHTVTQREGGARISDFARALFAAGIEPADRVALHAPASASLLIAEWAVIASRAVAVIVPRSFGTEDVIETLIESKSKIIILDRLATAYSLAAAAGSLPDLKYIICLEGGAQGDLPTLSWGEFIDSGRRKPDHSASQMRAITEKDTALLFYYKDTDNTLKATRYTHALLLDHSARISSLLGDKGIRPGELVLTATSWEHAIGHITACYVPILKEALVEITYGIADIVLFENGPEVTVGDAIFFDGVRQNILEHVRQSGHIESFLLNQALTISKESVKKSREGMLRKFTRALLKATILKKVQKMLGGKARLFIGTDDEVPYDIQLFFQAFGVELIELPQEAFR
jgi:long-subunit acyl-CoA synthetase (AMP-forming)